MSTDCLFYMLCVTLCLIIIVYPSACWAWGRCKCYCAVVCHITAQRMDFVVVALTCGGVEVHMGYISAHSSYNTFQAEVSSLHSVVM